MRKRIISLALAVLMVVCLLPASALADNATSGKCGDNLTWKLDANGTLTVSGKGAMYDYDNGAPWELKAVKSVVIDNGVTVIGKRAFTNCDEMTKATIPSTVTKIGDLAFAYCSKLESVDIPNSVTAIGTAAFQGNTALTSIVIPGSVKTVGDSAFTYCWSAKSVIVNEGVESLGDNALGGLHAAESIYLPKSLKSMGYEQFLNAKALGDLYFGGTEEQWNALDNGGKASLYDYTEIHFNCTLFDDVANPTLYYYDPVMWAVANGITNGMGANTFAPNNTCTRAQLVTFLWRLAGSEVVEDYSNPFADVKESAYYYNAVMWAAKNGVAKGVGTDRFAPDDTVTRCQVVTFLWRMAGSYVVKVDNIGFDDVPESAYYYNAVAWAVRSNITNGMGANTFAPNDGCTRGQTMTFLFRDYAGK